MLKFSEVGLGTNIFWSLVNLRSKINQNVFNLPEHCGYSIFQRGDLGTNYFLVKTKFEIKKFFRILPFTECSGL